MKLSRRRFLSQSCLGVAGFAAGGKLLKSSNINKKSIRAASRARSEKVVVLGMDGMDPNLLHRFVAQGELPTFAKFLERNQFSELQTTMPPHSPVAWSSFITGMNPGGHGIYDFVHRDPASFTPYMSTSRSFDAKDSLKLGRYSIPLGSGEVKLMREGKALWSHLEDNGVPSSVYQIPANFPVVPGNARTISGMGTPDLLGTYGTFTFFTETPVPGSEDFAGGRVVLVRSVDHRFDTELVGPRNSFVNDNESAKVDFTVWRDPIESAIKIDFQGSELVLNEGEWTEWLPVRFELLPFFASVGGMVRFYVKQVHPTLQLYCSPINVDPLDPTLPICTPYDYSREMAQSIGRFYTQGFPADSKALSTGILSNDEYFIQAHSVMDECDRAFDYELSKFDSGLFFFYFSSVDQNCHMLWRMFDPNHPLYEPDASPQVKNGILSFYKRMDKILARTLSKIDNDTTLFIVSDHGFSPFYREFNLSTWLVEQGYTVLTDKSRLGEGEFYRYVDWSKTSAYALGLNGIYINLAKREKRGWVSEQDAERIKREIMLKLPQVKDPANGNFIVTKAYDPKQIYSGACLPLSPDIVVGYQRGYRISDESVLGKFPRETVRNRADKWAGDHCLDPAVVPGVILSNRPWKATRPALWDMAPTILALFGIETPPEMYGRSIYTER